MITDESNGTWRAPGSVPPARRVGVRRAAAATLLLATTVACGVPDESGSADATWVGTIITDGNITTVINESGSVWGGTATLVEEASIGVDEGEDPYMFGRIESIWATASEILVLDTQVPAIRVFDYDGSFLRNIGAAGQGPGEYSMPFSIGGDPKGRLVVADAGNGRISFFELDGTLANSWSVGRLWCCVVPMVVATDGVPYLQVVDPEAGYESPGEFSMRAHGPSGAYGPWFRMPELEVPDHTFRFQDRRPLTPFAPHVTWTMAASGEILTGASHQYQFEIRRPDGAVTVVQRRYEPVRVDPEERDWRRRYTMAVFRRGEPGWTWDGAEMPEVKPSFTRLWPTAGGDIWAIRPGPGRRLPQCDPDADVDDHAAFQAASCWRDTELVDVFAPDGRFMGAVDVPDEVNLRFAFPWVSGNTVIATYYDESGTIMVKRYRLALLGEPQ